MDQQAETAAEGLLRRATVCDMTLPWEENFAPARGDVLDRFRAVGIDYVSLTVAGDREDLEQTFRHLAAEIRAFERQADRYAVVRAVDDIEAARRDGRLAVGFHFQGTNPLGRDLNMIDTFYKLGVRHILMAYNQKNFVGDGCHERTDAGLSRFGVQVIEEMNRVGMLVDCSHTGYRTSMDAFEASRDPVIFSHSNARALCDHERNLRDEQIRACAASGGVIGMNGVGMFIDGGEGTSAGLADHVDYIAQMVGPRHIGLGLDYVYFAEILYDVFYARPEMYPTGYSPPPWKFFQPEQLPEFVEILLRRGYTDDDLLGILGGNWMRVAGQVWK